MRWRIRRYHSTSRWPDPSRHFKEHRTRVIGVSGQGADYALGDGFLQVVCSQDANWLTLFKVVEVENIRKKVERLKRNDGSLPEYERAYQVEHSVGLTASVARKILLGDDDAALRAMRDATHGTSKALLLESILRQTPQPRKMGPGP